MPLRVAHPEGQPADAARLMLRLLQLDAIRLTSDVDRETAWAAITWILVAKYQLQQGKGVRGLIEAVRRAQRVAPSEDVEVPTKSQHDRLAALHLGYPAPQKRHSRRSRGQRGKAKDM